MKNVLFYTEREKQWLEELIEQAPTHTCKLDLLKKLAVPIYENEVTVNLK